ncbi:glycosyltransferase [Escherichia coli]|uniref:glycosyltransferase n=1 Tax=Escherichia coli TaxID=562 RepID=UPI00128F8889|nr:glycosyltransferase [Escherichia coli]EJL9531639.1 glycosyltransferase [Escherichia coli]EJL9654601.1 glycosyltransferase [Escherichia coli]ELW1155816.1 glycosyltransferase [Escherichia coli]MCZ0184702.1 glycosyltransferase [Escherichia coli]MCZ0194272.1 glycosyltransferase [Escherichia coli]
MNDKKKIDVVFNCSTNVVGGGIQNSVNFIKQVIENNGFDLAWFFLLSPQVYSQVKYILSEDNFYIALNSPASSLKTRKEIFKLVCAIAPKLVYTSAGPAYISFPVRHVMGCSNPYILGASGYAYKLYGNRFEQLKRRLKSVYQRYKIKSADAWIAQTEASEKSLRNIVGKEKLIHVVYNSVSKDFLDYLNAIELSKDMITNTNVVKKILVPTAYYKHKDLEKIPDVVALLCNKYSHQIEVHFTVQSHDDFSNIMHIAREKKVEQAFKNRGAFAHQDAMNIYKQYDAILQPSALEVFSTSYIEAMATLKPLIVPSLNFAESICEDYAHYYEIGNIDSYADAIHSAITDCDIKKRYDIALRIVGKYGSQEQRVNKIISLVKSHMA